MGQAGLIGRVKHLRGEEDLRHASRRGFGPRVSDAFGVLGLPFYGAESRKGAGPMPIRHKAHEAGVFDPSELALLRRVFEQLKLDGQTPDAREALASRIIANYMAGVTDEPELVSLSKQPLGR